MRIGAIDYAAAYFKYKTPTPIRGQPNSKSLKRLQTELQANSSSVETDLGGGNHGYLGLLKSDEEYALIPNTQPFDAPTYPAALQLPSTATPIEALELKDAHAEKKRLYLECKNVEKCLQRHIQDALEDKYIEPLVDEHTNLLTDDIPTIMNYLLYNYGKVRSEEVSEKEAEIMAMIWQPSEPLVLLTRPLENLQKLAKQANIPFTDKQILEKGLTLIRRTRDFEYALTMWEDKSVEDKTWKEFKTHFHEAQLRLKQIRGPTMQQAGYHHANALASNIECSLQTQLQDQNSQITSFLSNIPSLTTTTTGTELSEISTHSANSTSTTNNVQLEMLKLLQEMSREMKQIRNPVTTPRTQGRGQRRIGTRTPDDQVHPPRPYTAKYCWTHGNWGHHGSQCRNKAEGHKDEATKNNRLGGSNAYSS